MRAAVALPEDDLRLAQLLFADAAVGPVPVPEEHLVQRDTHLPAGVAAEMLVGEEQYLFAAGEGVLKRLGRVAGGADDAFAFAHERLQAGGAIHIGYGDDPRLIAEHLRDFVPAPVNVLRSGHVRHRTARVPL